ncbi:MAG: hypothetical protein ACKOGA_07460 [Planctomycetaceae bacterium]
MDGRAGRVAAAVWGVVLASCLSAGCTHPPVVLPDAADMLTTLARNQVSSQGPTRELPASRLDEVPQGSRCVVETTDSNPLRVVSGTVLLVSPVELVLREGTVRRLNQRRLEDAVESGTTKGRKTEERLREAIEEQRFEELRLAVSEVRRVSVYEVPQANWKRLSEGEPPRGNSSAAGARPGKTAAGTDPDEQEPEIDLEGWRPANRGP